ncbi:MAG TPA: DUF72 domain-containing protein [Stellaceae bacterium]|nr:DUF72 domain-containing protein [Stellaceae bacterium]
MSDAAGEVRIGLSGWNYRGWRGVFYPRGLRQRDELAYASRHVDSIEINGTFYSLKRPEAFRRWHDETPTGFVFAVKGSRFITHMKKLRDVEAGIANFFASGVLALRGKLGPFLWQLAPQFAFDPARLEPFLAALPRDTVAAAALAARHDHRVDGRALTETDRRRRLRHALEIRHPSFLDPAFIALLRRHKVALVLADAAGWPYTEDLTADFLYIRLHGSEQRYASGYEGPALDWWARRIQCWAAGGQPADAKLVAPPARKRRARDVYVYFDNDAKVRAPVDAQALRRRLPQAISTSIYQTTTQGAPPG